MWQGKDRESQKVAKSAGFLVLSDDLDEEFVHPRITRQLRMKGRRQRFSLSYQHGMIFPPGKHLDSGARALYAGSAYEHHLHRWSLELRWASDDRAVDLPAIRVSLNSDIQYAQALLCRIHDFFRQKNGACAGAKRRFVGDEVSQFDEKPFPFKEL